MKHSRLLIGLIAIIIICEAVGTGLMPLSRGYLFTLLSAKAGPIWVALILYFFNYLLIDSSQAFKGYVILKLSLWYRNLRTNLIKTKITESDKSPEIFPSNSPQRIQEDIKLSYLSQFTVYCEYIISLLILVQLVFQNLSEPVLITFALTYAVISIFIAVKFNPRLTSAEINLQQSEANYRTKLVDNIADITGLPLANKACIKSKWVQTEYLLFTKLQLGLIAVLPYAILLPKLLSGTMELGAIVQHQATFSLIVVNAAVLIQLYPILIQGRASDQRVKELENSLSDK